MYQNSRNIATNSFSNAVYALSTSIKDLTLLFRRTISISKYQICLEAWSNTTSQPALSLLFSFLRYLLFFSFHLHLLISAYPPMPPTLHSPFSSLRSPTCFEEKDEPHIFALISASNAFSLSKSVFCCGQPIDIPSSAFGLGI